jgi:hypothetical protein
VDGHNERVERRVGERRLTGSALDVSRVEHENLFRQVDEVLRRITRIERELCEQGARLEALEHASGNASPRMKRSK